MQSHLNITTTKGGGFKDYNKYIGKRLPKTAIVPIKLTIKAFNLI